MLCAAKIADKQHFAVNPLKLTSSKLADGVTMDNQQTVTFVNKGIAIQAQPAVQDLQALQNSLFEVFYPAAAVTADVAEVSQGILNFKWQDKNYSGILDYLVTSSKTTQTQEFQILPIHDVNADGTQDFEITYSTGDKQILFTLPR
jgi:hypothetical protein